MFTVSPNIERTLGQELHPPRHSAVGCCIWLLRKSRFCNFLLPSWSLTMMIVSTSVVYCCRGWDLGEWSLCITHYSEHRTVYALEGYEESHE